MSPLAPVSPDTLIAEVAYDAKVPSCANLREHWAARHRRVSEQRKTARLMLLAVCGQFSPPAPFPVEGIVVTLTRVAPRSLDDHDNLRMALKAVADGVADWLGVDDRDPSVKWKYAQRPGRERVEISVSS